MKTASFPEQFHPVYQYVMKDSRPQKGNAVSMTMNVVSHRTMHSGASNRVHYARSYRRILVTA
jgi:hypothetical protein